jgi:hypothetical protein
VIGDQLAVAQRFPHDPGRVEAVRPLADVLQDQDAGPVVDPWNRTAKAKRQRAKALITAATQFIFHK